MGVTRICSGLLIVWCVIALGCVADGPRPRSKPRLGPQPRDAKADILLLNIAPPTDTDGDTVPDTFHTSTHMFDERYQLPVRVDGTLTFSLMTDAESEPIQTWEFSGRDLQQRVLVAQVGPVYRFRLQMPVDAPPLRVERVTIKCVFKDNSGHLTQAWHRDLPWLPIGG